MGALWEERGEAAVGTGGACGALALPAPSVTWAERAVYPEQVGRFSLRPSGCIIQIWNPRARSVVRASARPGVDLLDGDVGHLD